MKYKVPQIYAVVRRATQLLLDVVKHHTTKPTTQIPLPIDIFVWRLTL